MKRKIPFLLMFAGLMLCRTLIADVTIDGDFNHLVLDQTSGLVVDADERLILKNLVLDNLRGIGSGVDDRLIMKAATSQLTLDNVDVYLDGDYCFTTGSILFKDTVKIGNTRKNLGSDMYSGYHSWGFNSIQNCTIDSYATLVLDDNITVSFGAIAQSADTYPEAQGRIEYQWDETDPDSLYVAGTSNGPLPDYTTQLTTLWNFNSGLTNLISLTLADGARLALADTHVDLQISDTLWVHGEDNQFEVTRTFSILGTLYIKAGAELTFVFNDQADDATIYFKNVNNTLALRPNARLAFSGNGTVEYRDGFIIDMQGNSETDKPQFAVIDSAVSTVQAPADGYGPSHMYLQGVGSILIDNGGEFNVDAHRQLIVGGQGVGTDDFTIKVDRNGIFKASGDGARISIYKTTGTIRVKKKGALIAGEGGTFEINAYEPKEEQRGANANGGAITSFVLESDGALDIREGGTLILGENADGSVFAWDSRGADFTGTGVVKLAEQLTFQGQLVGVQKVFKDDQMTAETVVRSLVNTVAELRQSSVMQYRTGYLRLRIKDSAWVSGGSTYYASAYAVPILDLEAGDVIQRDTRAGVGGKNSGNDPIRFDLSGNRLSGRSSNRRR
jgi:hypothetical protein